MSAAAESASATSAYSRFHDSVVRTLLDMQCGGQTEADVGCGIRVDVWVPDTVQGQSPPAGKLTGRSPSAALWDPQLLPLAQPGTMLELEGPGHFVPCSEAPSDAEDAVTLPDEGLQFNLWTKRKHEVLRQVCRASDAALGQLGAVRLRTVTFGEWRECDTQAERRALLRRKLAK
ncbi:unnamed protein product [Symbiodinium sp. KB8]|nr:unnamed protein product [Symbiodinium sp. KB8]